MNAIFSSAVTNARFASLHGLSVASFPLSTTPVPLLKPRARHERSSAKCRMSGGFRLRLGGGRSALAAIRYALIFSLCSTFPTHRPRTEAWKSAASDGIN